jgi:hypothetical protein
MQHTPLDETMTRVQVHISEDEDRWLEQRAQQRGTTKSALIREGIEALREQDAAEIQHMLSIIGMADYDPEGPRDGSVNHDRDLMQWEDERNHPKC